MMIIVCPLHRAAALLQQHDARRAISLLAPGTEFPQFPSLAPDGHLKLTFHDIVQTMDGHVPPTSADAERLVGFLDGWDSASPLLIHCWAGISRSTAAAFTALCMKRPGEDEASLAWELRSAAPSATPNRLIVSLVDDLLDRKGRMVEAIAAIGRGEDAFEGTPFTLQAR